ncbi:MAG: hypothetical protein LC731_02135 [Acidobacteria bacterium]|nr:hypothetical protein [Acidobacteriota bacterium]
MMKAITVKMLISLVGVAVSAPFILIALLAGARAIELARGAQDEALLVVLALSGAVISMINGFGRRTGKSRGKGSRAQRRAAEETHADAASAVNLSY